MAVKRIRNHSNEYVVCSGEWKNSAILLGISWVREIPSGFTSDEGFCISGQPRGAEWTPLIGSPFYGLLPVYDKKLLCVESYA